MVLGGQNSHPDCRRCGRSTRQFSRLELSLLDLFRQFDAADRDGRRVESLETQHRPSPLFHSAMILLHNIVQVFIGSESMRFDTASITISGIELAEKIKKAQFKTGKLSGRSATGSPSR